MKDHAVPKPEGYDFRDKLSDKDMDPEKWLPKDALFDAYLETGDDDTECMVCIWRSKKHGIQYRQAGNLDSCVATVVRWLNHA
jgi:hypothetical protein